jgi:hypothetical protein
MRAQRPDIETFSQNLCNYLSSIGSFLQDENILGPYAITITMEKLDELEGWRRPGVPESIGNSRPLLVESVDDHQNIKDLIEQLRSALFH